MAETLFIECSSLSVSYDVTGIATISYTVVHTGGGITGHVWDSLSVGNRQFDGYVTSAITTVVANTDGEWYETNVTLIAMAN